LFKALGFARRRSMTVASPPSRRSTKREPGAGPENDGDCGSTALDPSRLLAWYDRHRRRLPWRALPGEVADPYRVWLSEIMLQQTTVTAVAPYYAKFLAQFPTVETLAAAEIDEVFKLWAGLGYYARARNLHACAKAVVAHHDGAFPATEAELADLPGIGPYTAAAVAAIAFDYPASPVDGNIERVIARLYAIEDELPGAKPTIRQLAERLRPPQRPGDFAQAMMDLGATICTPKNPACALCPFLDGCAARRRGDPETFPRKAKKREGKPRRGAAFVALRADGHLLVRTRPARGLLGGMTEVPTTEFLADFDESGALAEAPSFAGAGREAPGPRWRRLPGAVTHVFTHFPLELVVFRAEVPAAAAAPDGMRWIAASEVRGAAFPSLMRKVLAHARVE
jgi:A/G-specific adenine glycosylase